MSRWRRASSTRSSPRAPPPWARPDPAPRASGTRLTPARCWASSRPTRPFMAMRHYEQACEVIDLVVERLARERRHFSGVMNSGFFATADGVKVIEFNARFGDPECMNIMSLFAGSWPDVMERICAGKLARGDVPLREEASLVLYLVSPDYALRTGPPYRV